MGLWARTSGLWAGVVIETEDRSQVQALCLSFCILLYPPISDDFIMISSITVHVKNQPFQSAECISTDGLCDEEATDILYIDRQLCVLSYVRFC